MKLALQIAICGALLASGCVLGWWLRGRHCADYFAVLGDFHATGIRYTANAYAETNLELSNRLSDAYQAPPQTIPRCFTIPRMHNAFEIVFYSGHPKIPFPEALRGDLSAFALKRLAEITAADEQKRAQ